MAHSFKKLGDFGAVLALSANAKPSEYFTSSDASCSERRVGQVITTSPLPPSPSGFLGSSERPSLDALAKSLRYSIQTQSFTVLCWIMLLFQQSSPPIGALCAAVGFGTTICLSLSPKSSATSLSSLEASAFLFSSVHGRCLRYSGLSLSANPG